MKGFPLGIEIEDRFIFEKKIIGRKMGKEEIFLLFPICWI